MLCSKKKNGREKIIPRRLLHKGIKKPGLKFNLGLALTSLRTAGPSTVNLDFAKSCETLAEMAISV